MISVSQAIKNSCKADSNTHTEYIVINNQTIYIKGKLSATAYKDTTFFGTFNMKVLEFETQNTTQFRNREFEYYKVIDGNAFKIGTFITTEVKDNDSNETVKVTANDYALKFAVPYTTELDYSSNEITLFDVLEECCENADVELENESIDNGGFIVDSNQFVNGEMIGDVISAVAGISGNFATITNQDKLRLTFANNTDEILSDYTNLEDKRDTQPITSVSIGLSQVQGVEAILRDTELIEQYGEHWLTINDNPFSYTLEKRQQLIQAIFDKVKGFGYSSFKSEYTYRPYLELGGKIKFKNKSGQLVDSIILRYTFDNDKCTFEAPSITKAEVDYEKSPDANEIAKRAEIIANQAEATIYSITKTVEDVNALVNGAVNYELTSDEEYQEGKIYYIKENDEYIELNQYATYEGDRTGNPSELGLYEGLYSYTYILTEDEVFDDGDYYEKVDNNYVLYTGERTGNPSVLGLYDRVSNLIEYQLTDDTEFVEDKTYFEKTYEIGDEIPANTVYEAIKTPSVSEQIEDLDKSVDSKLDGFSGRITNVETSVETLQTNTYTKTQVNQIVDGTGVDGVVVSATISESGIFDKDGLLIQKESGSSIISETTGRFNEKGVQIKAVENGSATNEVLYAGYVDDTRFDVGSRHYQGKTIVYTQNLQAGGETIIGSNCLLKDYESGTGWFVL